MTTSDWLVVSCMPHSLILHHVRNTAQSVGTNLPMSKATLSFSTRQHCRSSIAEGICAIDSRPRAIVTGRCVRCHCPDGRRSTRWDQRHYTYVRRVTVLAMACAMLSIGSTPAVHSRRSEILRCSSCRMICVQVWSDRIWKDLHTPRNLRSTRCCASSF